MVECVLCIVVYWGLPSPLSWGSTPSPTRSLPTPPTQFTPSRRRKHSSMCTSGRDTGTELNEYELLTRSDFMLHICWIYFYLRGQRCVNRLFSIPVNTQISERFGPLIRVFFRVKSYGPQGWVVGGDLLEDSFYIATGIFKILTFKNTS